MIIQNRYFNFIQKKFESVIDSIIYFFKKLPRSILYNLYGEYFWHPKGLHLGSGGVRIKDFVHIDLYPWCDSDICGDISRLKYSSNSVGKIYNSHVIEHIPRHEHAKVLKEWYRVLKPGGKLYIATPEFQKLYHYYLKYLDNIDNPDVEHQLYKLSGIIFGGQYTPFDYHYFGYSYATLKRALQNVGFKKIKRFNTKKLPFGNLPDAAHVTWEGEPISLNIVAEK